MVTLLDVVEAFDAEEDVDELPLDVLLPNLKVAAVIGLLTLTVASVSPCSSSESVVEAAAAATAVFASLIKFALDKSLLLLKLLLLLLWLLLFEMIVVIPFVLKVLIVLLFRPEGIVLRFIFCARPAKCCCCCCRN